MSRKRVSTQSDAQQSHMRSSLLILALFFCCGCGTPKLPGTPGATETFFGQILYGIERYLPLANGIIFHYQTEVKATGAVGVFVMDVSRDGELVELKTGTRVRRLQVTPEAISDLSGGGYLLKAPLELGASWEGQTGTIQVTSVDQVAQVDAGRFEGCLVTTEETQATAVLRITETTFCPNVGIVSIHVKAISGDNVTGEVARLRSFGEKIDIFNLDDEL